MKVLVITSGPDPHVQMVSERLAGAEFLIFDPAKIPFSSSLSYQWGNDGFYEIRYEGKGLNDTDVVWFRKPLILDPEKLPVEDKYRKYTHDAYKRSIQAVYSLLRDKFWVSDPWAILRANNKLLQQEIAHKRGLRIPETLVTNSAEDAKQFLADQKSVVVKPLGAETVNENGIGKAFYATRLSSNDVVDFSGLQVAPTIFQKDLVGCLDIRITVVGERVYACEIKKVGDLAERTDWRTGILTENLVYTPHSLPNRLSAACISIVRDLKIKFGAFDFMLDCRGNYWFLEVNPNGQWGFIEEQCELPISNGFAELFTERSFE